MGSVKWLAFLVLLFLPLEVQSIISYQNERIYFSHQSCLILTWKRASEREKGRVSAGGRRRKIICYF